MQNRFESEHSAFNILPKEIWQFIFQLSDIYFRDISSILQVSFALSQFANELITVVFKKHFPLLYLKLPEETKKNITLADLETAYKSDYRNLSQKEKRLFTYTKDGEFEKIQSLAWNEYEFNMKDHYGFTIVDWARKKGHFAILNYFYSRFSDYKKPSRQLLLPDELPDDSKSLPDLKKLKLAIACLQPIAEIDELIQLAESAEMMNYEKTCLRAARAGYIELLKAFLPSGKYGDKININDLIHRLLQEAIFRDHLNVVKLLFPIAKEKQEAELFVFALHMEHKLNLALEFGNKEMLLFLLNEFPVLMNSFDAAFRAAPELVSILLSHPRFQLTDHHLDQIKYYLMEYQTSFEMALIFLNIPNLTLGYFEIGVVIHTASKNNYPLENFIEILIKKNFNLHSIKQSIVDEFVYYLDRSTSVKLNQMIKLMIKYDVFDHSTVSFILRSTFKYPEINKAILIALSVSRDYQAKVIDILSGFQKQDLYEILCSLLELGYANDAEFRNTMFHLAAKSGFEPIVKHIASIPGHDVNAVRFGYTALMSAVDAGHLPIVVALYAIDGIDVDFRFGGSTAQEPAKNARPDIYNWMELQRIRRFYVHSEDSLLSMFTLFNIGRSLGSFPGELVCKAIDALAKVIEGEVTLSEISEYKDILLGTEGVSDIYKEVSTNYMYMRAKQ